MLIHFYSAVIKRETRKMLKQRDRLAAAMVRPVLWLWVIGGGMQALAGPDYTARLLPGIVGMTLLFGGMVGGLSIAFDKDAGTMRLLVTSPFATYHVLFAKALAAALAALVQMAMLAGVLVAFELGYLALMPLGLDVSALLPWVGKTAIPNVLILLPSLALAALSCGTLGVLVGSFAKSIDGFAVMMNFVIFPIFFFSGALYPTQPMPLLAQWIANINPFTYSVDLLRHAFDSHAEFTITTSAIILVCTTVIMLAVGSRQFSRSGASVPLQM